VNASHGTVTEPDVQTENLFSCYLGNPHTDHILQYQSFCWSQFVEKNSQPRGTLYRVVLEKVNASHGPVTEPDVQTENLFSYYLGNPHTDHILQYQSFRWSQFVEKYSQPRGTLYRVVLEKVNASHGTVTEPDIQTEILFSCYLGNPHTDHILQYQFFRWNQSVEKYSQPNSTRYCSVGNFFLRTGSANGLVLEYVTSMGVTNGTPEKNFSLNFWFSHSTKARIHLLQNYTV